MRAIVAGCCLLLRASSLRGVACRAGTVSLSLTDSEATFAKMPDQQRQERTGLATADLQVKGVYKELQRSDREYAVVDTRSLTIAPELLAEQMAQTVNWAYRGKHRERDDRAWTTERHLLSGIRTTAADVRDMLEVAASEGVEARALLVAQLVDTGACVGTVHVERSADGTEAEIGMFSVDPDMQGAGIGGTLLRAAERHAALVMGAQAAVLWVISSRADLLGWYARVGYEATGETAPFPEDANVGVPRPGVAALEFVRLEKRLVSREGASG